MQYSQNRVSLNNNGFYSIILNNIKNVSEEAIEIGKQIIDTGILKDKSRDDANHTGVAVANELDFIISWNFKHMVNIKTVNIVRAITNLRNRKPKEIVTPSYFLGSCSLRTREPF